jgi:hypothetical protein
VHDATCTLMIAAMFFRPFGSAPASASAADGARRCGQAQSAGPAEGARGPRPADGRAEGRPGGAPAGLSGGGKEGCRRRARRCGGGPRRHQRDPAPRACACVCACACACACACTRAYTCADACAGARSDCAYRCARVGASACVCACGRTSTGRRTDAGRQVDQERHRVLLPLLHVRAHSVAPVHARVHSTHTVFPPLLSQGQAAVVGPRSRPPARALARAGPRPPPGQVARPRPRPRPRAGASAGALERAQACAAQSQPLAVALGQPRAAAAAAVPLSLPLAGGCAAGPAPACAQQLGHGAARVRGHVGARRQGTRSVHPSQSHAQIGIHRVSE